MTQTAKTTGVKIIVVREMIGTREDKRMRVAALTRTSRTRIEIEVMGAMTSTCILTLVQPRCPPAKKMANTSKNKPLINHRELRCRTCTRVQWTPIGTKASVSIRKINTKMATKLNQR